jgi:hypothetical protein
MKVICISRGAKLFESQFTGGYWYDQFKELTIGKIYDIIDDNINLWAYDWTNYYHVVDDTGKMRYIHKDLQLFMELSENRKKKLLKIEKL